MRWTEVVCGNKIIITNFSVSDSSRQPSVERNPELNIRFICTNTCVAIADLKSEWSDQHRMP